MLSDPKVIRLFELLLEKKVTGLEPVLSPRRDAWVSYPFAETALTADTEYTTQLLEDLHRLGYLDREFFEKMQLCPACNSQDLRLVGVCRKCSSPHLLRQKLLEHKNCGYAGAEGDFIKNGSRVCPKCRVELTLVGSDYSILGPRYRCENCGELSESLVEQWLCRSCRRTYAHGDLRELVLYRYVLNQEQLAKLKVERIPKARVREFLVREGYEVQEGVQETGRSGAEHKIDLLASKRSGPLQHRIVVGFASGEDAVDSEEVIKLYAKAYDVNAQDIILIASPRLSPDAEQFAQHYHIKVYNSNELDRLAELQVPS
jgi:hypothetical protein